MHQGKRLTLLHLSDPQFGAEHAFARDSSKDSLANRLLTSLSQLRDENDIRPDLVVISGDLAERGLPSEFKEVETYIRTLAERLSLEIPNFVVVPGNHDISRKKSAGYFADCEGGETQPVLPYWPKYEPYAEFFRRLYGPQTSLQFTESQPFTFYEYPELGTVVAGLNSTIVDSHRDENHYGWVGEEQLRYFAERLRPFKDKGYLRLGVVHHDPSKFRKADALKDAEDLNRRLSPHLDVLLYGHTHADEPDYFGRPPAPPVLLLGIGSAGVVRDKRPDELPIQYQILRFSSTMVERWMMRYEPDRKEFIADNRGDLEGKRWPVEYPIPTLSRATMAFVPEPDKPRDEWGDVIEQYRERIAQDYRRKHFAELSGLLDDETTGNEGDLLTIFVMPQVEKHVERRRVMPGDNDNEVSPETDPSFPEEADHVLFDAEQPWVVLVGGPGAGKSTQANWLMLELCVAGEKLPNASFAEFVPVRIDMRRFALGLREHQGDEYTFFDYLKKENEALFLDLLRPDRLRKLAEQGRVWWIFDGLDEVVDAAERDRCIAMIDAVRRNFRGRGVITSREIKPLSTLGIPRYAIVALDNDRLSKLVRQFPMLETRRKRLSDSFVRTPALREVCRVPLLATMVALLSRYKDIPERRRALYAELIELLVDRWEKSKGRGPDDGALGRFDYRFKTKFLTSLAYRMMTHTQGGRGNVIGEDELRQFTMAFCVDELGETELVAPNTVKQLLSSLRHRHGILVYWGAETYGFVHRSFLDALAAEEFYERYLRGTGQDELAQRVRTLWASDAWRECLTMALGGIAEKRPEKVLRILQDALRSVRFYEADFSLYASFCIRVLSEAWSALEKDPLEAFALRLTELVRICGTGYFYHDDHGQPISNLLLAFREVGPRWPGAPLLRAWALEEETLRHKFSGDNVVRIAIATTPPAEHLTILHQIVVQCDAEILVSAVDESCLWRTWSATEIRDLISAAMRLGDGLALPIVHVFVSNGYAVAVESLVELMRNGAAPAARLEAAAQLLEIKSVRTWTDLALKNIRHEALTAILDVVDQTANDSILLNRVVQSALVEVEDPDAAKRLTKQLLQWLEADLEYKTTFAALVLGRRGNSQGITKLEELTKRADMATSTRAISTLIDLSTNDEFARNTLERLWSHAHLLSGRVVDWFVRWPMTKLDRDVASAKILELFELITEPKLKIPIAMRIRSRSALEPLGTKLLLDYLHSSIDAQTRDLIVDSLCSYVPSFNESVLVELLSLVDTSNLHQAVRFSLAVALIRPDYQDPTLRQMGEALLTELATDHNNADMRLPAAIQLRDLGNSLGKTILHELAQSPTVDESIRRFAARELRDLATLRVLAETAKSEQVRNDAGQFLALVDARRALLRVGRLRSAIVSLAGERVGILEETPGGSQFTYDAAWLEHPRAKPIAPSLPLRPTPYTTEGLHPFFENLLPEGWLLQITRKTLGVSGHDVFGLLLATCRDCIGAVEITPMPDEDDV